MLDRVVLSDGDFDAGEFAEALVYYRKVELVGSAGRIVKAAAAVGVDNLLRLIDSGNLSIYHDRTHPVVATAAGSPFLHNFLLAEFTAGADGTKVSSTPDEIMLRSRRGEAEPELGQADAKRLSRIVRTRHLPVGTLELARHDVLDQAILNSGVRVLLKSLTPSFTMSENLRVESDLQGGQLRFATNIDFEELNDHYHRRVSPEHSTITPAYVLSHFLTTRAEIYRSGDLRADLWLGETHGRLMIDRVESFADRIEGRRKQISRFEEAVLRGRSFGAALRVNERSFDELVEFVQSPETRRFKKWVSEASEHKELLREYDKAVFQASSLSRGLPMRVARILVFTGAGAALSSAAGGLGLPGGLAGAGAGLAFNTFDEFMLSKLKIGWRPQQWVSDSAQNFVALKPVE